MASHSPSGPINRNDNTGGNPRQVALYGLRSDVLPSRGSYTVDDWDEAMVEFAAMPGLIFDEDSVTQGIDPSKAVALGQISYAPNAKGGTETFSDPAITFFLRNETGGNRVTFLLAAAPGYTSTGQARIASKEAAALADNSPSGVPGDFAPRLEFQTILYPDITLTDFTMAGDQLTLKWIGGSGPYTLEKKTSLAGVWTDEVTGIEGAEVTITVSGDSGFFRLRGEQSEEG